MRIVVARPRGFCAGVDMATRALDSALQIFGAPLFAYHQIVHNAWLVDRYRELGVRFVEDVREVPPGAAVVFSAHGVSPEVRRIAAERHLRVVDATCPLVHKVHGEARRFIDDSYTILLIAHRGHDETEGVAGENPNQIHVVETTAEAEAIQVPPGRRVAYLTQTTLSVEEAEEIAAVLRRRFPGIRGPAKQDICYATENRQAAVLTLAARADLTIVVGSGNSSNSRRLAETSERCGTPSHLVGGRDELDPNWFTPASTVLVTSGASTPECVVQEVVARLVMEFGGEPTESEPLAEEAVWFQVPLIVRRKLERREPSEQCAPPDGGRPGGAGSMGPQSGAIGSGRI